MVYNKDMREEKNCQNCVQKIIHYHKYPIQTISKIDAWTALDGNTMNYIDYILT